MKFSAIIPCHNGGPWIQSALQSVANQTHQPHEIIVIDDASTDDSVTQIKRSGVGVRLLHAACRNLAKARNVGIEAASGDWVAFLDADDRWHPRHLEQAATVLSAGTDAAYIAHADYFTADGRPCDLRRAYPFGSEVSGLSHYDFIRLFCDVGWFCCCTVIVRTDVVRQVGGFDAAQVRRQDVELFMRVLEGRTWSYHPSLGAHIQIDTPGSLSRNVANCEYFLLRALLKNQRAYAGWHMSKLIGRTAKSAMKFAYLCGNDGDLGRAWKLAWPNLPFHAKAFYSATRSLPSMVRKILRARNALAVAGSVNNR